MDRELQTLNTTLANHPDLHKLGAAGGSKLYNDTTVRTGLSVTSIYVREDTVIGTLTGVDALGNTVNFLTTGFNISGVTLIQGDLLIAPTNARITAITLTSGSIIAYS